MWVQARYFQWSFGQACCPRGKFPDWNTHIWWGILSEDPYKLIRIYHRVYIEAYLLAAEENIFIIIAVLFPKETKGSYQIPSLFWAGSDDFLAPNWDFTLFEAVNMWWDFLEIRWTLEIVVLLLKYLQAGSVSTVGRCSCQLIQMTCRFYFSSPISLPATYKTPQSRGCTLEFFTFTFFTCLL